MFVCSAQQEQIACQVTKQVSELTSHVQHELAEAYIQMEAAKRDAEEARRKLVAGERELLSRESALVRDTAEAQARAVESESRLSAAKDKISEVLMQRRRTILMLLASDYELKKLKNKVGEENSHRHRRVHVTIPNFEAEATRRIQDKTALLATEQEEEKVDLYWERQWLIYNIRSTLLQTDIGIDGTQIRMEELSRLIAKCTGYSWEGYWRERHGNLHALVAEAASAGPAPELVQPQQEPNSIYASPRALTTQTHDQAREIGSIVQPNLRKLSRSGTAHVRRRNSGFSSPSV